MAGQPQMKAGAAQGWEAGEQDEPPARTSMHLSAPRLYMSLCPKCIYRNIL